MQTYRWAASGPWPKANKETDTEWKYKIEDGVLYIAFKGSTSRMDWKQNFSFWIVPYKNQPVKWFAHAGFVVKYKSVRDEILSLVNEKQITQVHVSGFSQGAAVATLCLEDLRFNFPFYFISGTLYGSPRVVWMWNYRKIKDRFVLLKNYQIKKDVVPKLPPVLFGYFHIGNVFKLGKAGISMPWEWEKVHMSYGQFDINKKE